jgi:hypothetical protein
MKYQNSFFLLFLLTISFSSFAQTTKHTKEELKERNEINVQQWAKFEREANEKEDLHDKTLSLISYGRWMLYQEDRTNESMEEVIKSMKENYEKEALTARSFGYNMTTFTIDGGYHDTAADYGKSETKGTFKIDEKGKKISIAYTFVNKMNKKKGKKYQMSYDLLHLDGNFLVLMIKGKKRYFHRQ